MTDYANIIAAAPYVLGGAIVAAIAARWAWPWVKSLPRLVRQIRNPRL